MRLEHDKYMTQEAGVVLPLLDKLDILETDRVLECCVGNGGIAEYLPGKVITNDLYPNDYPPHYKLDAGQQGLWDTVKPDWTVTNPPFNEATPILERALTNSSKGVAFLLRLSYTEPTKKRRTLLQSYADCMRYQIVVNPRLRFVEGRKNSDLITLAWFVWLKGFSWKGLGLEPPFGFLNWRA